MGAPLLRRPSDSIVYHDDNANGIPHAHVVVNNTNLKTGNRMQTRNPLELNRALQDMARERGLSGLSNESKAKSGVERLAEKEHGRKHAIPSGKTCT
mgnify:CR=1 FL=1